VELHFHAYLTFELATGAQTYGNFCHFPQRKGCRCLLHAQLGNTSRVES